MLGSSVGHRQAGWPGRGWGSGTASRTGGHVPGSLWEVLLLGEPHTRSIALPEGRQAAGGSRAGGGQAGPTFVHDTAVMGELRPRLLGAVSWALQRWPGRPRELGTLLPSWHSTHCVLQDQ